MYPASLTSLSSIRSHPMLLSLICRDVDLRVVLLPSLVCRSCASPLPTSRRNTHNMQQQQQQQQLKNALDYLADLKNRFASTPAVYSQFLDLLTEFKTKKIDTQGVIQRVKRLFQGHRALIIGFNQFLPLYELDASKEFKQGLEFAGKVKCRLDPDMYDEFLDTMYDYRSKRATLYEVQERMDDMFKGQPDLLDEFEFFLHIVAHESDREDDTDAESNMTSETEHTVDEQRCASEEIECMHVADGVESSGVQVKETPTAASPFSLSSLPSASSVVPSLPIALDQQRQSDSTPAAATEIASEVGTSSAAVTGDIVKKKERGAAKVTISKSKATKNVKPEETKKKSKGKRKREEKEKEGRTDIKSAELEMKENNQPTSTSSPLPVSPLPPTSSSATSSSSSSSAAAAASSSSSSPVAGTIRRSERTPIPKKQHVPDPKTPRQQQDDNICSATYSAGQVRHT